MINSTLTLVGAGPGDPELITLKAVNALKYADVVLYDALVDPVLLEHCSKSCLKVFVGKRGGQKSMKQGEINGLILHYAKMFRHVVRLKGGDPFIFGRGFEELEYAEKAGLETRYIPGISSSFSVGGMNKIPMTSRGASDSFWVITGTKSNLELSEDLYLAAQSNATVVVLMGMNKLQRITEIFQKEGKQETPVAVIQNGSTAAEKKALGTISDIQEKVSAQNIGSPAVIIIGKVVGLYAALQSNLENTLLQTVQNKTYVQ